MTTSVMSESLAKKLVEKYPLTGPYYTSYPAVGFALNFVLIVVAM